MQDTPGPSTAATTVASMTGFARMAGASAAFGWTWEARSVNHRGLDVRLRLPPRLDALEPRIRELLSKRVTRGSVTISLELKRQAAGGTLAVNREMILRILDLQRELGPRVDQAPPRIEALLAIRGVLEAGAEAEEPAAPDAETEAALLATLGQAVEALVAMRAAEGRRLAGLLASQVDAIEGLTREALQLASLQPNVIAERLQRQVQQLAGEGLPPERLAQEVALLATRSDATEELDRLTAHVAAARELLAGGGPIGRRLDFLSQEFNREANTLTAKSGDMAVTRIGLALKGVIDQFREQVQNVE